MLMLIKPALEAAAKNNPLTRGSFMLVFLFILVFSGCSIVEPVDESTIEDDGDSRGTENQVSVELGEDYSLPSWVSPESYAGYVCGKTQVDPEAGLKIVNWYLSWADLEPERGQYNWNLLEQGLADAAAGGYQLNLHLQSITLGGGDPNRNIYVDCKVPGWIWDEFSMAPEDSINLGWEFDLLVIPGWRAEICGAFNDLVRAIGERGYPQNPNLASAYIHAISPSRGEEFWMTQPALDLLERDHGFSVQTLDTWITSRLEAYADAFQGVEYKLVWVGKKGSWQFLSGGEYAPLAERLVNDAWALGAGNRSSAIEFYNSWVEEPALGMSVDDQGYLNIDESLPAISSSRYFGDENEEYGPNWTWRFGDQEKEEQRYRFSLLRSLQMRMRFLWTSEAAETINPALSKYTYLSMGKSVDNTPDAWAYLRESPVNTFHTPAGVLKNFERWLVQRDLPGGMTVSAQRENRDFNAGSNYQGPEETWYDDVARRTDIATGNDRIYFDLDDRLSFYGDVEIKVEILDDVPSTWRLDYVNSSRQVVSSSAYTNLGDGQIKTVTFSLDDARFVNGLENGMDFQIFCDGVNDVTVRWVRVISQQSR